MITKLEIILQFSYQNELKKRLKQALFQDNYSFLLNNRIIIFEKIKAQRGNNFQDHKFVCMRIVFRSHIPEPPVPSTFHQNMPPSVRDSVRNSTDHAKNVLPFQPFFLLGCCRIQLLEESFFDCQFQHFPEDEHLLLLPTCDLLMLVPLCFEVEYWDSRFALFPTARKLRAPPIICREHT